MQYQKDTTPLVAAAPLQARVSNFTSAIVTEDDRKPPLFDMQDRLKEQIPCCIRCTLCCCLACVDFRMIVIGVPADAKLLSANEQGAYAASLQGDWSVEEVPTKWDLIGNDTRVNRSTLHNHAIISGQSMLLSGGTQVVRTSHAIGQVAMPPATANLKFFRDERNNRVHIDSLGSFIEALDANWFIMRESTGRRLRFVRTGVPPPAVLPPPPPQPAELCLLTRRA
jgi:hypothetical protein